MTLNTTDALITFLRGFYCGFNVAATNAPEYPIIWGFAPSFCVSVTILPFFQFSKDTLMFEEWTKVNSLS